MSVIRRIGNKIYSLRFQNYFLYNNIYNGSTSLMAQNGMVHIIDTNKEKSSDYKLGFIRLFQSKFNGTYTTIKGYYETTT